MTVDNYFPIIVVTLVLKVFEKYWIGDIFWYYISALLVEIL